MDNDDLKVIIEEAIPSNHEQLTREQLVDLVYSYLILDDIKSRLVEVLFSSLTDDERVSIFRNYCCHCGSEDMPCYCMADD